MPPDGAHLALTTVLAGDGPSIHLTVQDLPWPAPVTLCGVLAGDRVRARQFHRLGCLACAVEALARGATAVHDLQHATLNLPRFVAARSTTAASLPEQGDPATERL